MNVASVVVEYFFVAQVRPASRFHNHTNVPWLGVLQSSCTATTQDEARRREANIVVPEHESRLAHNWRYGRLEKCQDYCLYFNPVLLPCLLTSSDTQFSVYTTYTSS